MPPEKDVFRDTPVRFLGYANELGESFRSVINVKWVWMSYGVASAYVLADASYKTLAVWKADHSSERERAISAAKEGCDVLLWQSLASVVIPGFTINRICSAANFLIRRSVLKKNAKWATVGVGLSSIPFIITPIDTMVDYGMDRTLRPLLGTNKEKEH